MPVDVCSEIVIGRPREFVANFLTRRIAYTYEVAELVPGERLMMRTAHGPFPMETSYEWESTPDGGTRMRLRNRGEPGGFFRLVLPILEASMRRANRKDLARLRSILEAPG